MRARSIIVASLVTFAVLFAVAACSVVGDGKVSKLRPAFGLDDTLAPSTTEAATTTAVPTTVNEASSTTAVQTEPVRLYFITNGQLTYVTQAVPAPAAPQLIIKALQAGPQGELGFALRTAVPSRAAVNVQTSAGVAVVDLPPGFFDSIAVTDQRLVIGQMVLTLTDSRGVGQVQFNQAVPKPSGEVTPAGQLLTKNDFQTLLLDSNGTTTSTTTAPTTRP
jgi:hypothetical protein